MKRVKRGYADVELWDLIDEISYKQKCSKQEGSRILANHIKNNNILEQRDRKFDIRF